LLFTSIETYSKTVSPLLLTPDVGTDPPLSLSLFRQDDTERQPLLDPDILPQ